MPLIDVSHGSMSTGETVCALLTPTGRGAVAVISVRGPKAEQTIDRLFDSVSDKRIASKSDQSIFYGRWQETGEDVVVVRIQPGICEIHCHGGIFASAAILNSLQSAGCRQIDCEQFSESASHNQWQRELQTSLSHAQSAKTALILLRQCSLADSAITNLVHKIQTDPASAAAQIELMMKWAEFGFHLCTPWTVVFCGPPNVGKSSLVNRVIGYERTIVHQTAGTTRDVVSQLTAVDGWPIEIKDTAGLRVASHEIERLGVELSRSEIASADLVVAVIDATQPSSQSDSEWVIPESPMLNIVNKIDLCDSDCHAASHWPADSIFTSATTGVGISELTQALSVQLVPELPSDNVLIPINTGQVQILEEVRSRIEANDSSIALQLFQEWFSPHNR